MVEEAVLLVGALTEEFQRESDARLGGGTFEISAAGGDGERREAEAGGRDAGRAGGVVLICGRAVPDEARLGVGHLVEVAARAALDLVEEAVADSVRFVRRGVE